MIAVVADASALLDYLLGNESSPSLDRIMRRPDAEFHVPAMCDVEIVSGLRRQLFRKVLDEARADMVLIDYNDLPLRKHAHRRLLPRILALRHNFSAYDACYVALAEDMGATLLTTDGRLMTSVRNHTELSTLP